MSHTRGVAQTPDTFLGPAQNTLHDVGARGAEMGSPCLFMHGAGHIAAESSTSWGSRRPNSVGAEVGPVLAPWGAGVSREQPSKGAQVPGSPPWSAVSRLCGPAVGPGISTE